MAYDTHSTNKGKGKAIKAVNIISLIVCDINNSIDPQSQYFPPSKHGFKKDSGGTYKKIPVLFVNSFAKPQKRKTHKNKFTVLCKSVSFTKTIKHLLTQNLTTMGKTVKNKEKVKDW